MPYPLPIFLPILNKITSKKNFKTFFFLSSGNKGLSKIYMKQQIKVRIEEEMSEGRETERGLRQGCPLSPTLFNIYLEDLMKNCFLNMGGVGLNIGGRRIKCIRFADDMVLLAADERMLKNMLMELNN